MFIFEGRHIRKLKQTCAADIARKGEHNLLVQWAIFSTLKVAAEKAAHTYEDLPFPINLLNFPDGGAKAPKGGNK